MDETLGDATDLFPHSTYLPRVTRRDGRALEEALAAPTLFDAGLELDGAVLEATYAIEEPPLLKRLREAKVPQLVDPQTLRLTGERFMSVSQFEQLPYRPDAPITADSFTPSAADVLARDVMLCEQVIGASWYLAAGLPYYDKDLQSWIRHNDRLLEASCAANGATDLDRKPLIAQVAPGRKALAHPQLIVNRLLDYPIDGVYVHPLRLDPVRDSVEKLAQYIDFLMMLRAEQLTVISARVGAFGLVLGALGIDAFDSGLGQAETCDLASLNRPPTEHELASGKARGGGQRRIYLEQLKTTLLQKQAEAILTNTTLRSRVACTLPCCEHRDIESLAERARPHYLRTRLHETTTLAEAPSDAMRRNLVHSQLHDARETAKLVRRALRASGAEPPAFDHIERWMTLLAREHQASAAA